MMIKTHGLRWIRILVGVWLGALIGASMALAVSVDIMPVSELKPGMTGDCVTTLKGFEPERLKIEILGVIPGIMPNSNRILFIGTCDKFKRFGVLGGMSGSPCYIDGKLIGALSYGWFAEKEPIGGITPIEEMLTVLDAPVVNRSRRSSGGLFAALAGGAEPYLDDRGRFRLPTKGESIKSIWQTDAELEISEAGAAGNQRLSRFVGAELAPIPLSFVSSSGGLAGRLGFSTAQAGSGSAVYIDPARLCPGCPLGEVMITGDLDWSGMGTLTYIDGDTILAFGHPSFGGGSVSYPMCSGIVHTGFPSYFYNHKISSGSQPLGVITQDRYPAIAGKIGAEPDMLPVDVHLMDADSGKMRAFHFDVMRDRLFTPFLLAIVSEHCVYAFQHDQGEMTIEWDILVNIDGRAPLRLHDSYSDVQYSYRAFMGYMREPFAAIIDNGFEDVRVENVESKLKVSQSTDLASIMSIDVDKKRARQGESVQLNVGILPFEGKKETLAFDIAIPKSGKPGRAEMLVFGTDAYQMWEMARAKARYRPQNYADVVDMLVEAPNHRQLIVVLARRRRLTMRGREPLPELPASARAILSSAASSETMDKANFEVLQKLTFDTNFNLSGKEKLGIQIKPKKY